MNVVTETEQFPAFASLAISPNLQALLEFDDRLRTSSEDHERSAPDPAQPGQYPSWRQQEVPTVSLPPPRRKKSVVTGVPVAVSEVSSVASSRNTLPTVGGFRGLGEIIFADPEDVEEDVGSNDLVNPHLNAPPSPPRYFYPRSDDEEEWIDQPSYTLKKTRTMRRPKRQRSLSDKSPAEHKRAQLFSSRYFASPGRNAGSRPKEKGKSSVAFSLNPASFCLKASGPRVAATRPLLSHSHKASLSSSYSHQVRPASDSMRTKSTHVLY